MCCVTGESCEAAGFNLFGVFAVLTEESNLNRNLHATYLVISTTANAQLQTDQICLSFSSLPSPHAAQK